MNTPLLFAEMPASKPIVFNPDKCIGCNRCVDICQVDLFIPNTEKGKPPVVLYPGECWYCGCCVVVCPKEGGHYPAPSVNEPGALG